MSTQRETITYHEGKSFCSNLERQDFKGISDNQRSVGNVIEEVEDEDHRNSGCKSKSVSLLLVWAIFTYLLQRRGFLVCTGQS